MRFARAAGTSTTAVGCDGGRGGGSLRAASATEQRERHDSSAHTAAMRARDLQAAREQPAGRGLRLGEGSVHTISIVRPGGCLEPWLHRVEGKR